MESKHLLGPVWAVPLPTHSSLAEILQMWLKCQPGPRSSGKPLVWPQRVESECSLTPSASLPNLCEVSWGVPKLWVQKCREGCFLTKLTLHLALPFKKLGPRSEWIQPPTSAKGSRRGRHSAWPPSPPHTSLSQHPSSQPALCTWAVYFLNTWGQTLSSRRVTGRHCLQQS